MGVNAVVARGKIFKLGGVQVTNGKWNYHMDFEQYDPAEDAWTMKAAWTYQREPLDLVAIDDRLFVVGGGAFSGPEVHSLREYDFAADRWVLRPDMPALRAHTVHPTLTVLNGRIYTFGGGYRAGGGWRSSDCAQSYDPKTDAWQELPPLAEAKIGMGVAVVGNRIYLLGGEKMGASGQSDQNERSRDIEIYEIPEAAR
jgi:N-acetylneuraminic acid mutarotase